jgi:hypothetical protein
MKKEELKISDILKAFETFDSIYKHYEKDEAIKRQER